jgi:hypothetical protein
MDSAGRIKPGGWLRAKADTAGPAFDVAGLFDDDVGFIRSSWRNVF